MNRSLPDSRQKPLPSPDDRPAAHIILFDGHCRFCTAQVRRLHNWDRNGLLSFLSLHDPQVQSRWPELSFQQLMDEMYLITPEGEKFAGAAAFRYLSTRLPILWPLVPLMHIPGSLPLWRTIYKVVAKYRYRLAGKSACDGDACEVHFR